jgi:Cu/Ag efflux protein CusF
MRFTLGILLLAACIGIASAQVQQKAGGENRALDPTVDAAQAQGLGEIRFVDGDGQHVSISHGPIPEMSWPALGNHRLAVSSPELLKGLRPGQRVRFTVNDRGVITVLDVLP